MVTFKWQYRPGKSNVADPSAETLELLLLCCLMRVLCPYAGVLRYSAKDPTSSSPSIGGSQLDDSKVSQPAPTVRATFAAMTHSKVSQRATESEMPASEPSSDSSDKETAPVSDLSHYEKRCVAALEKDLAFQD